MLASSLPQTVQEYERAVLFRLGRALPGARGPGNLMCSKCYILYE